MVSVFEVTTYVNDCPFNHWLEEFKDGALANFWGCSEQEKKAILMQVYGEAVKKFVLSLDEDIKNDYLSQVDQVHLRKIHLSYE